MRRTVLASGLTGMVPRSTRRRKLGLSQGGYGADIPVSRRLVSFSVQESPHMITCQNFPCISPSYDSCTLPLLDQV